MRILSSLRFCWCFTENIFREKFFSRNKVGGIVPSGESSYENTADSMPLLLFLSFPSSVLKESSVSKQ